MKWGEFYKAGGAAGFNSVAVKEMSLWEFLMTIEGWRMANGVDGKSGCSPPTEDEFEAAIAALGD